MLVDIGCTSHYLTNNTNLQATSAPPLQVQLPKGDVMTSSGAMQIPFSLSSKNAQLAHIFPQLTTANLLSIGKLCNDDCIAIFDKNELKATKKYIIL